MEYTIDYFIEKFEAIPEHQWCTGEYVRINTTDGSLNHCALGHCGVIGMTLAEATGRSYTTGEGMALNKLFRGHRWHVSDINDGHCPDFKQPTPKQRVLAALQKMKG